MLSLDIQQMNVKLLVSSKIMFVYFCPAAEYCYKNLQQ